MREIGEARLEPRQLRPTLADWTNPRVSPLQPRLFGPPVGIRLAPRSKDDIPLIELQPTDNE